MKTKIIIAVLALVVTATGTTAVVANATKKNDTAETVEEKTFLVSGVPAEYVVIPYEEETIEEEPEEIEAIVEEIEAEEPEEEIVEEAFAPIEEPAVEAPAPESVADPEPVVEETIVEEPAPAPAQPAPSGKLKAPESALLRRTGHGFYYGYSFATDCDVWCYELAFSTCTGPDDSAIDSGMPLYPQMWMEAHGITDVDEMWTYWINNIRPTYYGCWDRQGSSSAWQTANLGAANGDVSFSPDLVANGPICW